MGMDYFWWVCTSWVGAAAILVAKKSKNDKVKQQLKVFLFIGTLAMHCTRSVVVAQQHSAKPRPRLKLSTYFLSCFYCLGWLCLKTSLDAIYIQAREYAKRKKWQSGGRDLSSYECSLISYPFRQAVESSEVVGSIPICPPFPTLENYCIKLSLFLVTVGQNVSQCQLE